MPVKLQWSEPFGKFNSIAILPPLAGKTRKSYPKNLRRMHDGSRESRLSHLAFLTFSRTRRQSISMLAFIGHLKIFLGHCPPMFRSS